MKSVIVLCEITKDYQRPLKNHDVLNHLSLGHRLFTQQFFPPPVFPLRTAPAKVAVNLVASEKPWAQAMAQGILMER